MGVVAMNEKEKVVLKLNNSLHTIGRIMMISAILLLVAVPFAIGAIYDGHIDTKGFLAGFLNVAVIYVPVAVVEFLVYTPMLGVGGSYISFITGNVTNMKIPCAINARDIAKTEVGTPENEIISTISTATSAIVTTVVILAGVILLVPLRPVFESDVLRPAFDNVVPALFGALALKYYLKGPKIAIAPVLIMSLLCIFVPAMINETSILIIPSGGLALLIGFILFKKGKL